MTDIQVKEKDIDDKLTCIRKSLMSIQAKTNQLGRDIKLALSNGLDVTLIQKNEGVLDTLQCELTKLLDEFKLNVGDTCQRCEHSNPKMHMYAGNMCF